MQKRTLIGSLIIFVVLLGVLAVIPFNKKIDSSTTESTSILRAMLEFVGIFNDGGGGEGEGKGDEAIGVPVEKEPAPDWVLDKAEGYIVSYVGQKYFDEHIFLKKSFTNLKVDKMGAKYKILYSYEFKINEDVDETLIDFNLWLDPDGGVVEYEGPQKPYSFTISRKKAIEIAKTQGLPESDTETIEKGGQTYSIEKLTTAKIEFGPKFDIDESYVWHVSTENFQVGKPVAVYIDVDSGDVLGTYVEEEAEVRGQA